MSPKPRTPAAAEHFQDFIRAGIADLCRLAEGDGHAGGRRTRPRTITTPLSDPIPQAADLAMYLMLLTRGLQPIHGKLYEHRERLAKLLERVYRAALKLWDSSREHDAKQAARMLKDVTSMGPAVKALARFAEKHLGGLSGLKLSDFGVTDVHVALVNLSQKLAATIAQKVAESGTQPGDVLNSTLLIANTAGLYGGHGGHSRATLVRASVRAALATPPADSDAREQYLRRFMKRLGKVTGV